MKMEEVRKMNNIYLTKNSNSLYVYKMPSSTTETKIALSRVIVSDCVKGINGMANTMSREISGKMLGEKNDKRRAGFIIKGKHSERRFG